MTTKLLDKKRLFFFGFSRWKRKYIKPFFKTYDALIFCHHLEDAIQQNINSNDNVVVWGIQKNRALQHYCKKKNIAYTKIEDGFIRSVALGVDFSQPYSLVIDTRGIYFDTTCESDLEYILNTYDFDENLLQRSQYTQKLLIDNHISKYNLYSEKRVIIQRKEAHQKVILVIGQVEGDASLIYGANNMKNLELLATVYRENSEAYILYKPHPDVLRGRREGHIDESIALQYCHQIETEVSIDSLLKAVDEVHTMTSLVGFEALLRGKKVVCYGMPFYAGWGLTTEKQVCSRRKRKLTLNELVAGTYILYPQYIDPITLKVCEVERTLEVLIAEKKRYHRSKMYRLKVQIKNFLYRKYHALLRHILRD